MEADRQGIRRDTVPNFPMWAKPNAGVPRMDIQTEQAVYDMSPEDMANIREEVC